LVPEQLYRRLADELESRSRRLGLGEETVRVAARDLSPEEAIGNPEHRDYPLIVGRERMMEALVRGTAGQAYTDMYGCWDGPLREVWETPPANSFRRAILVATLNAVMRYAGELQDTAHCKDSGPVECAQQLPGFLAREGLRPPFALIGYQPRLAETLAALGELRLVDLDVAHIGQLRAGVSVHGPEDTEAALRQAGTAFVTGSTAVNGTIGRFLDLDVPTVFYGVTIAGPAQVLGLARFCPLGR
jgi:hypothetical protein